MRDYQFKTISNDNGVYLVCKFYRSSIGECHVGYIKIAARDEASAVSIAKQAI
jgi:hypothetical protein